MLRIKMACAHALTRMPRRTFLTFNDRGRARGGSIRPAWSADPKVRNGRRYCEEARRQRATLKSACRAGHAARLLVGMLYI